MPSNKETSAHYFDYKVADMDEILTPNFIGRHPKNKHTWNLAKHKEYWTDRTPPGVTILNQIEEGDIVAVRVSFGEVEAMQFQRFEDGKIAEIWEMYST
jgi:hypothetical protein